ncbi:MAG: hypothetical protein GC150_03495 [Rhizobiales bacterium]|nr:hypothetical protein [Hyphomicrobiales bacterium]
MSHASSRFEITDRVIDFGSHIVNLSQVTSVRVRRRSIPGMIVGLLLLLAGLGLLGLAVYSSVDAFVFGGPMNLLGLLAAVPGLALALIGRYLLFELRSAVIVAASDGAKVAIPAAREELLVAVFQHIKQAIATENAVPSIRIDLSRGSIDTVPALPAGRAGEAQIIAPHDERQGQTARGKPAQGHHHEHGQDARFEPDMVGDGGHLRQAQAGASTAAYVNGGAEHGRAAGHGGTAAGGRAMQRAEPSTTQPQHHNVHDRGHVGVSMPTTRANARPEQRTVAQIDDILVLMDEAKVPYQDDLERMLFRVRSHLTGEGASREEAVNNWVAFAEYARDYLSGVEGLIPLIDQVHASSVLRQA